MRNRTRSTDHLNSKSRILVNVRGRCELRDHVGPLSIHLIGKKHRQSSLNSLSKLEPVDLNHDLAVRSDIDERVRWIDLRRRLTTFLGQHLNRRTVQMQRNEKSAGCCKGHTQEAAAIQHIISKSGQHGASPLFNLRRSALDGLANARVRTATTKIAAHRLFDIL